MTIATSVPRQVPASIEPAPRGTGLQDLLSLVRKRDEDLHTELLRSGALLFRNFDLPDAESFRTFVRAFSKKEFFGYEGGVSPRTGLGSGVYTSTEYPHDMALTLHNEMSYTTPHPSHLYFFCVTPPQDGGETTLGDSRRILSRLDREIVDEFRRKQVRYERRYLGSHKGSGYSWQDAFETDDRHRAEEICERKGMKFEWSDTSYLSLIQVRPATAHHPLTGEEVWFNQAEGFHPSVMDDKTYAWFMENNEPFRLNSRFGDGTEIPLEMLAKIRMIISEETIPHRWMKGDVVVVDNVLAAHGRMPFSGERKIVLAMT